MSSHIKSSKLEYEIEYIEKWLDHSIAYKNIKTRISKKAKDVLDKLCQEFPERIKCLEFLMEKIPLDFVIPVDNGRYVKVCFP